MKSRYYIFCLLFLSLMFSANADENSRERVLVYTDNDCYLAGEYIWMKFCAVTPDFAPSGLSRVGYVEISDTRRPYMQLKLALEDGAGSGRIKIPSDIPSGIYELSGYTRYMRNEGESAVFRGRIAVINPEQRADPAVVEIVTGGHGAEIKATEAGDIRVVTDRAAYATRSRVGIILDGFPQGLSEVAVSVRKIDGFVRPEAADAEAPREQVSNAVTPFEERWEPEYEGHIVTVEFEDAARAPYIASLAPIGENIGYFAGRIDSQNGKSDFYSGGIHGQRQVVASVADEYRNEIPARLDIVSPYAGYLPQHLPVMQFMADSASLAERYLALQLDLVPVAADYAPMQGDDRYYRPYLSYDLNNYTRFPTVEETIREFVSGVQLRGGRSDYRFRIFPDDGNIYNSDKLLLLLDGVPVYDHGLLAGYDPYLLRRIDIYGGTYLYGGTLYEGILSFVTEQKNLPGFRLGAGSLLVLYDFPSLPEPFALPDYSDDARLNSREPDFRHTLYWNPVVKVEEGEAVELSFYTSDLSGTFEVSVRGLAAGGRPVSGTSVFKVEAPSR